jgi:basic membrane protein A
MRSFAVLGAAALMTAGCGAGNAAPASQSGAGPSPSGPASGPAAGSLAGSGPLAAGRFRACLVADIGGIHDRSVNASAWQGIQEAAKAEPGRISGSYLQSSSASDYSPNISRFIGEKCGIIVTVGVLMADNTLAAARRNPSQEFATVNSAYPQAIPNIDALLFDTAQAGFLGGYLAAGMTRTGKVATFGGEKLPTVTGYMDGFWDGVQYYNAQRHAHVAVLGWNEKTQNGQFTSSFLSSLSGRAADQATGQADALALIREGADIIFPAATDIDLGAAEAVRTADAAAGSKDVNMLWVQADGCGSAPQYCKYFISSVTIGIQAAVRDAVLAAAGGTFHGGDYHGTLANGGAALAPYHDFAHKIPATLKAEIATLAAEIASGKIRPATASPLS